MDDIDTPVKLVIWDLDETFWNGTISEGDHWHYSQENHEIVIELARRGIISSVCSKNDYTEVEPVLKDHGILDYFIMPSIDWSAKGPRIKNLIDDIHLRPENVLFIDDTLSNLAEAQAFAPGLQIATPAFIPKMLENRACLGAQDLELTRLHHYQHLQFRKQEEKSFAGDNIEFLRNSDVRVLIQPNIGAHYLRAIELVNRTNQLNFTKQRFSSDSEIALEELRFLMCRYYIQVGLVRVWDKYGDYGYSGFYAISTMHGREKLLHFCFSCRTLGMMVERWLYNRLGRPEIDIVGEVASSLENCDEVDWINQGAGGALLFADGEIFDLPTISIDPNQRWLAPEIRMRGGCEMEALSHYLRQETPQFTLDTHILKSPFLVRRDTISSYVLDADLAQDAEKARAIADIQLAPPIGDFFADAPAGTLFVISCWGDMYVPNYQHKTLGFKMPLMPRSGGQEMKNLLEADSIKEEKYIKKNKLRPDDVEFYKFVVQKLRKEYLFLDNEPKEDTIEKYNYIFSKVPRNCLMVLILPHLIGRSSFMEEIILHIHDAVKHAAKSYPNIIPLDSTQFIDRSVPFQEGNVDHLDRMTYFRMYNAVMSIASSFHEQVTEDA